MGMYNRYERLIFVVAFVLGLFASCSRHPYHNTNKIYKKQAKDLSRQIKTLPSVDSIYPGAWPVGAVNFNLRKPNYVIIHHTAQNSCQQTLKTFTTMASQVSAHYVICKDGTIHHMLNDYLRAWHGGVARWGSITDINSSSIGIEIDNNGFEVFTEQQLQSLLYLLDKLKKNYGIPAANFIGHSDIAPVRKVDPNVNFPWKRLSENGFGIWYDVNAETSLPPNFNNLHALRLIGYDIRDTSAAIMAFKRRFLSVDKDSLLTVDDQKVLWQLAQKSLN
jgi:N-acetylmuramoyl-L-alanine amidase